MGYELREHTADVAVAASGETLADVFAAVADGLAAASSDDASTEGERFAFSVRAESLEALLFDYLDELVYLRDVRAELPVENAVSIEVLDDAGADTSPKEWHLSGSARGIPLQAIDAREVKAVTYSDMRLERRDDSWEAYVVFDV